MISIVDMRHARDCVLSEIETGRPIIPQPFDYEVLRALTDQDLADILSHAHQWETVKPEIIQFPKADGQSYRTAHYISPKDRVLVTAILIAEYQKIYEAVAPYNGTVNYDRPLPAQGLRYFLEADYHDTYVAFKNRIWSDERDEKWIVHTDIRQFAPSCQPSYLMSQFKEIGFGTAHLDILDNIFNQWAAQGVEGVPQGYVFTDIMLKIYLMNTDQYFTNNDRVSYYRYVDDIIITTESKDEAKEAVDKLREQLGACGLSIKETELHYAKPGETGHGHSYQPASQIEAIKTTLDEMRRLHPAFANQPEPTTQDLIRIAYQRFMSPRNADAEQRPKYLISYLLRQMRAHDMDDFVGDMKGLIEKYPDRTFKLLKSAVDVVEATKALNGLTPIFFNPEELDDKRKDGIRLEYLSVLRRENYQVSQYDLIRIQRALNRILEERSIFKQFQGDVQHHYRMRFQSKPSEGSALNF